MTDEDKAQRAAEQEIQAELERRWHEAETAERAGLYGWSLDTYTGRWPSMHVRKRCWYPHL